MSEPDQTSTETGYQLRLPLGKPIAAWIILGLIVGIYAIPALLDTIGLRISGTIEISDLVRIWGAKINELIYLGGQYYRFITAMFLHANLMHIFFNAYALYSLGMETERIYGTPRFLMLYLLAGLGGGIASYAFNPDPSVGASGAIFGLVGGLAAFYYLSRKLLGALSRQMIGSLVFITLINLGLGFSSPLIDNSAHLGGLVVGAIVGLLLAPRYILDQRVFPPVIMRRSIPIAWAGAAGLLVVLIILALAIRPPMGE